jgi:hypothetical protein
MKKLFSTAIMLIVVMTVHAGGAREPQTGGATASPTTAPTTAAQLAAALNAMNEGSARASGNTVTLNRNVGIQRDLTVPEGVTLELMEGRGLWLDGVTLTVNGTVKASGGGDHNDWNGGLNIGDGATIINGNGTIDLTGKGQLFGIWSGDSIARKLTLDGVTLVGIADNNSALVNVSESGELVMVSGTITGNGGGVSVGNGGTFTMQGGAVTGITNGGGVNVHNGSTFTMSGGAIRGNGGGGVSVGNGGTFTMSGGAITGNTNDHGGGVRIDERSVFTMIDGAITGNTAQNDGGVAVYRGSFTMKGGTISGNTSGDNGGGVGVWEGSTFIMEGGVISGNTARFGGGVRTWDQSTFIMEGGTIYGSNEGNNSNTADGASLRVNANATAAKWGTGGTYTKGGVNQSGGSAIVTGTASRINTDDTLIAIPAR